MAKTAVQCPPCKLMMSPRLVFISKLSRRIDRVHGSIKSFAFKCPVQTVMPPYPAVTGMTAMHVLMPLGTMLAILLMSREWR